MDKSEMKQKLLKQVEIEQNRIAQELFDKNVEDLTHDEGIEVLLRWSNAK